MKQNRFKNVQWEFQNDIDEPTIHGIWTKEEFPTYIARTCYAGASEQNARLIASAPELLSALQNLLKITGEGDGYCDQVIHARQVINKALGIKED